ncbi:MAG TPA: hypothetical protein VHJ78_05735 [Actinomycetota bacterium]|nr:hypothetical protein [Actinomycetota bacterium]
MAADSETGTRDKWLERLSAVLFFTQIVHLVWMTTYVIPLQLGSSPIWSPPEAPLALADYLELPAIIATSALYIRTRNWTMLLLVNVQLFHIFWITDEFVLERGTLNPIAAWIAILIDYLELPVIIDTIRRAVIGFFPGSKAQPADQA